MEAVFIEGPVRIDSALGSLELGVVDAQQPGIAEGVSRLLNRSIQDARAEVGGHLPSWLVDDIQRNYISPEKVRTLWAATGHRFALRRTTTAGPEIIGTIHIAKSERMILTVDRNIINVDEDEHPGFKPPRHHHVVNISVLHELRRARLGTLMVDGIVRHFRHLFSGVGLWVRADPPWHPSLSGLGFVHDPSLDVFLPPSVERTSGLPHPELNRRYACTCGTRRPELDTHKLQYVSMTRLFEPATARAREVRAPALARETLRDAGPTTSTADVLRPTRVDEVADALAWASRHRRKVTLRGQGQSYAAASLGDDVVLSTEHLSGIVASSAERVTVRGGTTWRALLTELIASGTGRFPPVVPSWVESSIGGTLASASGGIGKGSLHHGMVIDHVESLLVVTGDGRRVACSARQAGWLFDAVLTGEGRFGVIAEATLRLAGRPGFVERSARVVEPDDVADALTDPALEHASAELRDGRYRVLLTRPAERGLPVADHLLPPESPRDVPRDTVRAELPRAGLRLRLDGARGHAATRPEQTFRIHPVRERPDRPGLLRRLVTTGAPIAAGEVRFFTQATAPAPAREAVVVRTSWETAYEDHAGEARRAKHLADPHDVLGSTRYIVA